MGRIVNGLGFTVNENTGEVEGILGLGGSVAIIKKLNVSANSGLILFGDSMMGNVNTNAVPSGVTYDNGTGVLTFTLSNHGHYTGMDCRLAVTGDPRWETRNVPLQRVDANTFTLQAPAGLGSAPAAASTRAYFLVQHNEASPFTWLNADRPKLLNYGVNGETVAQIYARLPVILTLPETVVWMRAGTNNAANDESGAVADLVMIEDMIKRLVIAQKTVIISTIPPVGTTAVGGRYCLALNRGIRDLAATYGAYLIDEYDIVVDPTSAVGNARSGYLQADNTHFTSKASLAIAAVLQPIVTAIYVAKFSGPTSALDGYHATNNPSSKNVFDNPTLQTASGGTNGSGAAITGTIAGSITCYAAGAGFSAVASVVTAGSGVGNAQRMVASPVNDGDTMQITTRASESATAGRMVAGKKYKAFARCKVYGITGQNVIRSVIHTVTFTNGEGTFSRIIDHNWAGNTPAQYKQNDIDTTSETPEFTLPAGCTSVYLASKVTFGAAGTAVTFEISEISIQQVG